MKRKSSTARFSKPVAGTIGAGAAILLLVVAAAVGAICIQNEYLDITSTGWIAFIAHLLGSYLGANIAGKLAPDQKLLFAGVSCIGYLLLLGCITLLFFDGITGNFLYCITGCISGYVAYFVVSIMSQRRSGSRKRRSITG